MTRRAATLALLALAAAVRANPTATATSTSDVSYTLGSHMSLDFEQSVLGGTKTSGQFVYNFDEVGEANNPVYEYLTDGPNPTYAPVADPTRYHVGHSGSTGIDLSAGHVAMTATSAASFASVPSDPSDLFYYRVYGVRLFMKVTNHGGSAESIVFDFNQQRRTADLTTDIPYDSPNNLGQYAEGGGSGDVYDITQGEPGDYFDYADTLDSANGTHANLDHTFPTGSRTFTLAAGATAELEIYTSAYVFLEDDHRPAPVPEPASLAALGVGAAALLRRRPRA